MSKQRKSIILKHMEKCKYELKKIKMENLTDDDLEKSLSDKSDSESDNDKDNEECNE